MIILKLENESKHENSMKLIIRESLLTISEFIFNNFKSR